MKISSIMIEINIALLVFENHEIFSIPIILLILRTIVGYKLGYRIEKLRSSTYVHSLYYLLNIISCSTPSLLCLRIQYHVISYHILFFLLNSSSLLYSSPFFSSLLLSSLHLDPLLLYFCIFTSQSPTYHAWTVNNRLPYLHYHHSFSHHHHYSISRLVFITIWIYYNMQQHL